MPSMPDGLTVDNKSDSRVSAVLEDLKRIITDSFVEVKRAGDKTSDTLIRNMIGPLKLVTDPLEKLTGVDFVKPLTELPGALGKVFQRKNKDGVEDTDEFLKKKVQPSRQELAKQGVIGAAAIHIAKAIEDNTPSASGGGLPDDFGGVSKFAEGAAPALMKAAGVGAIVAGVIWGVVDGIMAYGKAEEWGVSGIAAGLGGFFGGSGEGGDIKDAFKNAGKFAIMGAGIGLLAGGPLGALAGGLAGAAFGGILGWIGGENIAKFFQGVGDWFKGVVGNVKEWLEDNKETLQAIKDGVLGVLSTMFGPLLDGLKSVFSGLSFRIGNIKEILGDEEMTFWQKAGAIGKEILLGILEVPYNFIKGGLASFFGDRWQTMSDIMGDEDATLWQKIGGIGKEVFLGVVDKVKSFVTGIFTAGDGLIKLILNDEWTERYETFKEEVKAVFGFIFGPIVDGVKDFFTGWMDRFGNIKEIFGDDDLTLWEKIKGIGGELIGGLVDGLKSLVGGAIESVKNYFITLLTGLDTLIPKLLGEGGEEKWEAFKDGVKEWFGMIFGPFIDGIKSVFSGFADRFANIKDILGDEDATLWEKIKGVGKEVLFGIIEIPLNLLKGGLSGLLGEERWGNIQDILGDDEATLWDKIKGVGKEVITGIIERPINIVKGWIDGLMNNEKFNEMKEKISGWFNHIGNAVGNWIWGILPDWSKDALRKLGIGPEGDRTEAGVEISNKMMKQLDKGKIEEDELEGAANKDFIEGILKNIFYTNTQKLLFLHQFEPSRKLLEQIGITSEEDIDILNSWKFEPHAKVNEFKELLETIPVKQVKDAVIYKDGRLIEPSPDDNIVLTTDTPNLLETRVTRQLTSDINEEYFTERIMDESNRKFDRMIVLLETMVSAIQEQETGAVIQNISHGQYSLDALRMGS